MIPSRFKVLLFLSLMSSWTIVRAESQSPIVVETLDSVNASALFVMETTQEQILEEESGTPTSGSELQYQMQILQEHLDKSQVEVRNQSSQDADASSPLGELPWSGSHNQSPKFV